MVSVIAVTLSPVVVAVLKISAMTISMLVSGRARQLMEI